MRVTVGKKLTVSFFIILFLLLIASLISASQMKSSARLMNIITEERKVTLNMLDLRATLSAKRDALVDVILFGQNDTLFEKYLQKITTHTATIQKIVDGLLKTLSNSTFNVDVKTQLEQFVVKYKAESETMERILDIYRAKGKDDAANMLRGNLTEASEILDQILLSMKNQTNSEYDLAIKKYNQGIMIAVIFFVIAVIAAILISSKVSNSLVSNIIYLTNSANEISLGSVDTPITAKSNDELGELAEVFERLRLDIKKVMEKLRKK